MAQKMTQSMFEKRVAKIFAERRAELLEKLKRLDKRRKGGEWGYRRIYRKAHQVPSYRVGGHYAMVPVKVR